MQDDWSKRLADRWGLAWCKEDVELHQRVAPRQPLRRLYKRLCNDPDIPFLPPEWSVILFICFLSCGLFAKNSLSLVEWPIFLVIVLFLSGTIGLILDLVLWPVVLVLHWILEGVLMILDFVLFSRRYLSK